MAGRIAGSWPLDSSLAARTQLVCLDLALLHASLSGKRSTQAIGLAPEIP